MLSKNAFLQQYVKLVLNKAVILLTFLFVAFPHPN